MADTCATGKCVTSLWIISRVVIVTCFFVLGLTTNAITLKIFYNKQRKQASKIYMLGLAWVDLLGCTLVVPLLGCTLVVPLLALWEVGVVAEKVFVACALFQTQSYLFIQVAMVFDRIFAVYAPHKFNDWRRSTNRALLGVFVTSQASMQVPVLLIGGHVYVSVAYVATFVLGFTTITAAYPAIALKLWKQSRRIKPTAANQQNQPSAATGNPNKVISETQQRTKHHVKTLKLYVAVLALYLMTFISTTIATADLLQTYPWVLYLYYVNSVGNPFLYYMFNDKFRSDVNKMVIEPCL